MKVKNVIAQSPKARQLANWLEGVQKEGGIESREPEFMDMILDYPIDTLIEKNLPAFQRDLQVDRLIKIAKKILEFGFLIIPIVLDETLRMIDGQHRVTVAKVMGLKTVPVVVYKFKTAKDKPKLFAKISMPEGGAPAILDRMNSRKIAGYPYETMIHRLIMLDDASKFYDRVIWKGTSNNKSKITLPVFIKMFNWIGLGVRRSWQSSYDEMYQHMVSEINEEKYIELRGNMNRFATWLFAFVGDDRSANKDFYKDKIIVGIMDFYLYMIDDAKTENELKTMRNRSIQRFRSDFNPVNVLRYDHAGVLAYLLEKYNKSKPIKSRMQYRELGVQTSLGVLSER